jgi:hypothetical protein
MHKSGEGQLSGAETGFSITQISDLTRILRVQLLYRLATLYSHSLKPPLHTPHLHFLNTAKKGKRELTANYMPLAVKARQNRQRRIMKSLGSVASERFHSFGFFQTNLLSIFSQPTRSIKSRTYRSRTPALSPAPSHPRARK